MTAAARYLCAHCPAEFTTPARRREHAETEHAPRQGGLKRETDVYPRRP